MSPIANAERFLWLQGGPITEDDPVNLLEQLVRHFKVFGFKPSTTTPQLERRIADLVAQLSEAKHRLHEAKRRELAASNRAHDLERLLAADHLYQRVQELETEVKKANERTRSVEHLAVRLEEKLKTVRNRD